MTGNVEGEAYWSARAAVWLADTDALEVFGGAPGEAAIDRLDPRPGERILDIGCGAGNTSVAIARRVQPGGRVLGVDIATGMVAGARRRAEGSGVPVSFTVGDAQVHDFGEIFDGAYSRFGVMFFTDPVAAFANIRRAAHRLSFCCWQDASHNEWMMVPNLVTMEVLGTGPPDTSQPGPFALADPTYVRHLLDAAGYSAIDILPRNDQAVLAEKDIPRMAQVWLRHGMAGQLLREAAPEVLARVVSAVEAELRSRVTGGVVRLGRGTLLVTAR